MYCSIQQVLRKTPDRFGEPVSIIAYQNRWRLDESKPFTWGWKYSDERFPRPHMEAYKITLCQSFREGGQIRKRQYSVCTMSYYDIADSWWGDCVPGGEKAIAEKCGLDEAEVFRLIDEKLGPLTERIYEEFRQSPEYAARQDHEAIRANYMEAQGRFCSKYGVDKDDFARCYDIFLTLRNADYLSKIKAESKARKQAEREYSRSYWTNWSSTYSGGGTGSYSAAVSSTYTDVEKAMLRKFYRTLAKAYHPDLNPGKETTAAMALLNRLKEGWGI